MKISQKKNENPRVQEKRDLRGRSRFSYYIIYDNQEHSVIITLQAAPSVRRPGSVTGGILYERAGTLATRCSRRNLPEGLQITGTSITPSA